jgi:BirA family biotin operon repressor/biotin-[acetyl-CoA-carboxylase] ligase
MDIIERHSYTTGRIMSENPSYDKSVKPYLIHFNSTCIGRLAYYYPEVESTNLTAIQLAKKGAVEGTMVIAGTQVSGRGRLQRTWFTPKGNVALSVILKPSLSRLPQLVMMASLSVVRAIYNVCGLQARIKWPNDVLINGKKVSGILIESEVKKSEVNYSVIGIGMNVNLDPSSYPDITSLATSLSNEAGSEICIDTFIASLVTEMDNLYTGIKEGTSLHREWQINMETIGRQIQVRSGDTIEQGKAEATTENGSLLLRRQDGSIVEVMAGDVSVLKT